MKLNCFFIIVFSMSVGFVFSQQMPLDFSQNSHQFTAFSNSQFAFNVDPTDANNDVGQFFNDGSTPWQGFFIDLTTPVDLDNQKTLTLSFYQFDPNVHTIMLKLENGTNADVEVVQTDSGSGWASLSFDFSNAVISGTTTAVDATGTYSRLTIFIDGGQTTSGTYFIDDINDGSVPVDPNVLDVIYTDLVWSDEFDSGPTPAPIDASKWHHQTFGPNGGRWFNGEQQHYTNRIDNSYVQDGFLNIVAKNETFSQDGVTLNYTSARLNSKFAFTYGRVDVRAKLPFGDGTWPAIWTLGKNINETGAYWQTQGFGTTSWPACGEIDIMEHGLHATNEVSCAIHTPSSFGATVNTSTNILTDVANDFHVYSVNWSPNQMTFLIDGVGYYTYNPAVKDNSTWPFDLEQFLLLNVAMGGVSGSIDPNFVQSSMVVDYVRVYQNNLSIDDDSLTSIFKIYPNPSSGMIHIKTEVQIERLELYNTIGQLVVSKDDNTKQIDVQNLNSGIYVLKIYTDIGNFTSKKIIVD